MWIYNYHFRQKSSHFIILCALSCASIVFGVTPEIKLESQGISFNNQVMAQNVSDADLKKYAQAAMEIETIRKSTFENIESMVGKSKLNQINCHQEESLNQLPGNARSLAINYCQQSEEIVKKHGLTINQFNQITQQVRQNPSMKQKLQAIIGQM